MQPLNPGPLALDEIQRYVAEMEEERGFSGSPMLEQALRLAEETGEVCKAVRKATGMPIDPASVTGSIGEELADVLIYLAAIANRAGVDLADALRAKEQINETRVWTS
ncbi:MazG nucleotide pyrophosphohydrolase domain-containing protein [Sphaerisporangium sp. TRM90804]|uniref:MazG nucleotide pyrophosphohydrolase domain-containing protein n=1 Tax=Sphaerisporangium sp. TRM90804 TaxID=3031113 RepID=UPI00244922C5|nr:MazG nucleotide pyrophosphohydrolase domain-containing protein [Sphaerisporangium sp. TRM90804]MDH2427213.1 MazG nucleotide pyrophosphohydrolase domain-containing protein [Sphaerisporangium sp. TRM90804]